MCIIKKWLMTYIMFCIINFAEGIETLVRMLVSDNPKVREYACLALSNLTYKNTNNCRYLLNHEKKNKFLNIVFYYVWIIRNILSFAGVEPIVSLLKDEKDTTKAYSCICLINMSSDEIMREEVARSGFSQSIISSLSSPWVIFNYFVCLPRNYTILNTFWF
jgi:uncharacterized protein YuzB (UPF0349 family)